MEERKKHEIHWVNREDANFPERLKKLSPEQGGGISLAFLEEHCDMILAKNAIQTLTSFK